MTIPSIRMLGLAPTFPVAACLVAVLFLPASSARAQLGGLLNQNDGNSSSLPGGFGNVLQGQSLTSGSTGNVAGLLQYCIQNNYLDAGGAASVKDGLMKKLGRNATSAPGYGDGASGVIDNANGHKLDLSGAGLKQQAARQVCNQVLSQGKSMM
ncbi:MAG TPA: DUF2501 domain-containing protein [Stellaceae bacterium]|jgi:hypothetical protein|nr:DUF2501 domain-containing protein [Stellaceae bacterium]